MSPLRRLTAHCIPACSPQPSAGEGWQAVRGQIRALPVSRGACVYTNQGQRSELFDCRASRRLNTSGSRTRSGFGTIVARNIALWRISCPRHVRTVQRVTINGTEPFSALKGSACCRSPRALTNTATRGQVDDRRNHGAFVHHPCVMPRQVVNVGTLSVFGNPCWGRTHLPTPSVGGAYSCPPWTIGDRDAARRRIKITLHLESVRISAHGAQLAFVNLVAAPCSRLAGMRYVATACRTQTTRAGGSAT